MDHEKLMSEKYRLMVYFAHSTMMLYDKDVYSTSRMSVTTFRSCNPDLIKRVDEEAKNIFGYELSNEQMDRASYCYLQSKYSPQDVHTTEAYKP